MNGIFSTRIATAIEIAAPAEVVWAALVDFRAYPRWHPSMLSVEGRPAEGERLRITFRRGDGAVTLRPRIVRFEEKRELRWLGHVVLPGLLDGEHRFVVEPLDPGRCRLRQEERFRGLLVPFMAKELRTDTRRAFDEANAALRRLVAGPAGV